MTSEPHFQLSEGHAHFTVLQTEQAQPAKFKAFTPQQVCISARLVLLNLICIQVSWGILLNCRFWFSWARLEPGNLHF